MKKGCFYLILFVFLSCKNSDEAKSNHFITTTTTTTSEKEETYHVDTTYEYESRTGESGNYEYNYDVSGTDEDGNDVTGNIDIEGKYGRGSITDLDGNEVAIEVEWIDYGKLKATDDDGKEYELEVD